MVHNYNIILNFIFAAGMMSKNEFYIRKVLNTTSTFDKGNFIRFQKQFIIRHPYCNLSCHHICSNTKYSLRFK